MSRPYKERASQAGAKALYYLLRERMQRTAGKGVQGVIQFQYTQFCRTIILLTVVVILAGTHPLSAADDASGRKKELQRINREMHDKKQDLKRADKKERSILSDLDRIDREVQADQTELADQQRTLRETEASLREIEKNNTVINGELSVLKELYMRRVRTLYKMSKNGYAAGLIASTETTDPFKRIKYLALLAERDQRLIADYGSTLQQLAGQQAAIAEKRQVLMERNHAIEAKKYELDGRKRKKAVLLATVRKEKGLYEQTLRELEESSTTLWAMVRKAEEDRKAAAPASLQASAAPGKGNGGGKLLWPLDGPVLTRFGMQRHPQFKTMVFRRGIEIAAREGEAVHAVSDGLVMYADWYKGYGKLMIIEHGPGFYTLYGNLSQLQSAKGDRVVKGQVIGLAGDTGSLKGSKLYFEVRRNGEAQDPLLWLAKR